MQFLDRSGKARRGWRGWAGRGALRMDGGERTKAIDPRARRGRRGRKGRRRRGVCGVKDEEEGRSCVFQMRSRIFWRQLCRVLVV